MSKKLKPTIKRRIQKYSPTIIQQNPVERNQLGFAPRFMTNAALPKELVNDIEWCRQINNHTYRYLSPSNIGLPGGPYSRLIYVWLTTLARRKKSKVIHLGPSLSSFMKAVHLKPTGGKKGNFHFKDHFLRCINCVIHRTDKNGKTTEISISPIIEKSIISDLKNWEWHTTLNLSDAFFKEAMTAPPIDFGAMLVLSTGTLRVDILNFLTTRLFSINRDTQISWSQLYAMFASPGSTTKGFRQSFKDAFDDAIYFYAFAKVKINNHGLLLSPSPKLIPPLEKPEPDQ